MKFKITSVRELFWTERSIAPLKALGFEFEEGVFDDGQPFRLRKNETLVCLESLDDLIELTRNVGNVIVSGNNELTIFNGPID